MNLEQDIDLLSSLLEDIGDFCHADEWIAANAERAYPRQVTARAYAGDLVCQARIGSLISIMPIDADHCGSDAGCNGSWHCLTGKADAGEPQRRFSFD